MKKAIHYFIHLSLFCLVWCVLNESFSIIQIILGIVISFFTMLFVNHFLLTEKYSTIYAISPIVVIRYILYLGIQIYKSGIISLVKIIYGKDETQITTYKTKINHEIKIGLLANAVTSTPGTVTLEKEGQELSILSLGEFDDSMLKVLEKILGDD